VIGRTHSSSMSFFCDSLTVDSSLLHERLTLISSLGCVKDISLPPSVSTAQELTFGTPLSLFLDSSISYGLFRAKDMSIESQRQGLCLSSPA
jgi:hypothetical protein